MSVNDPLLKSLKAVIINLCVVKEENRTSLTKDTITDSNENLRVLCEVIEEIIRKGLYRVGGLFNSDVKDYWHWFQDLPKLIKQWNNQGMGKHIPLHSRYDDCLRIVKGSSDKVDTNLGRGRLMLRAMLQHRILHWPLEVLSLRLGAVTRYYSSLHSLLGNEVLAEMLVSQLAQLAAVRFELELGNSLFLHESWTMPLLRRYEFVPCKQLGVSLVTVDAYQVVERLQRGSVAAEDAFLECGDVLDSLLGQGLKWCRQPLRDIMQANHQRPVQLSAVKARLTDGSIFLPIHRLLRKADLLSLVRQQLQHSASLVPLQDNPGAALPIYARPSSEFPDDVPAANPCMDPNYGLRYVGSTYIGSYGGVTKIEGAIAETLRHYNDPSSYVSVYIELGEKDLIVKRADQKHGSAAAVTNGDDSGDDTEASHQRTTECPVLFAHAYPQISSCGRRVDCTRFLAYIVGESTCTISRHFVCHVFEARTEFESKSVLCSIAQGFERTHWTI